LEFRQKENIRTAWDQEIERGGHSDGDGKRKSAIGKGNRKDLEKLV